MKKTPKCKFCGDNINTCYGLDYGVCIICWENKIMNSDKNNRELKKELLSSEN